VGEVKPKKADSTRKTKEMPEPDWADEDDKKLNQVGLQLQKTTTKGRQPTKEGSRRRIALTLITVFAAGVLAILVLAPFFVDDAGVKNIKELLAGFGAIFGTPLGFILGYYFRTKDS